jgi:feruloyl esterase
MRIVTTGRTGLWDAVRVAGALVVLTGASATPARAQAFADLPKALVNYAQADLSPKKACDTLSRFRSKEIEKIQAQVVAATATWPEHCRVTGTLSPEIAFEVSLPAKWNGRFFMIGNGGHAGESLDDAGRAAQRHAALQQGFAFAQTNTGHDARTEPGGTFVLSNPQKATDYAYRAVHLTATTTKSITKDYYGRSVSKAYWHSCSNGGRQGLIEAQRYPDDFDGIIANAPWVDQTGFTIGAMWNQRALSEAPVSPAKLATVARAVMNKCDAIDGLTDGLIDDPRACRFDPAKDVPACTAGADGPDCLTPAQAGAMAKVYSGPVKSDGTSIFPGFMPGSEALIPGANGTLASGWMNVIVPPQPGGRARDFELAENTMKYLVQTPPKPEWDYKTFDYDKDLHMVDAWSRQADAKNPDLSKFRKRGGKVLMTYGWADGILQPMMGVNYYQQATAVNGPNTPDFFRLFMIPGMAHCQGGIGTDRHDPVTAIINWVEKGEAPSSIIANRAVNGTVTRTRPLCAYPQVARYKGQGSIDDAANFSCVAP